MIEGYGVENSDGMIVVWQLDNGLWDCTIVDVNHVHPYYWFQKPCYNIIPPEAYKAIDVFIGGNEVGPVEWGAEYFVYFDPIEVFGPEWEDLPV